MAVITEDYVSFEISKLLKEKGFNEKCEYFYDVYENGYVICSNGGSAYNDDKHPTYYSMPTLQMTMKWLREVYNIFIEICLYKTNENDIEPKKSKKAPYYTFGVWNSETGDNVDKRLINDFIGDTYEEACEEAIKYCLKNLKL